MFKANSWRAMYNNNTTGVRPFNQVAGGGVQQPPAASPAFPGPWPLKPEPGFALPPQMNMSSSSPEVSGDFTDGVFGGMMPPTDGDGNMGAGLYGALGGKKFGGNNIYGMPNQPFFPFDATNGKVS